MSTATAPQDTTDRTKLKGLRVGVVTSDKNVKTRTVTVMFQQKHPKYGKYISRQAKFHVHDEQETSGVGDRVEIAPCRPMSKTKNWRVVRVIEKAPEQVDHAVAPEAEGVATGGNEQQTED